jgi:outer membrane murein-binding lipoprotein Lpp
MKQRKLFSLITLAILLSLLLSGCQSGGVPQAQYDQVSAQVAGLQSQLALAQMNVSQLQVEKSYSESQLQAAQQKAKDLESQVAAVKAQATLTGATPAETAAKIVKYYQQTHVYSAYDLFVCSDMASEVWNMLKAQNISAVIVVGNTKTLISDILQCDHAWVMATVGPGDYLALETTGGRAVRKTENPLYYVGWSFSSPADLKSYNDMVKEYNTRVGFRNQLNTEANKAAAANNTALYAKLVELRTVQETELNNLRPKFKSWPRP